MQKMPFAFRLRAQPRALMHTRIRAAANLCSILLHYYHSWSPVRLIIAWDVWIPACSATYVACMHSESSRMKAGIPPRCSNTSLRGSTLFSWCNMLGSWRSGRTAEEMQPKPPCFVTRILIMQNLWFALVFSLLAALHLFPLSARERARPRITSSSSSWAAFAAGPLWYGFFLSHPSLLFFFFFG